jgi:hypothetical protein
MTEHWWQDNPFASLSLAQTYAFVAKQWGEDGLRKLFSREVEEWYYARKGRKWRPMGWLEQHQDAADELAALGLTGPAKIVAEHAETLPSLFDESQCPYPKPGTDRKAWLEDNQFHRRQREAERKKRNSLQKEGEASKSAGEGGNERATQANHQTH